MDERLVLLYNGQSWGVYDNCTCPSFDRKGPFPEHFYKEYFVKRDQSKKAFEGLLKIMLDIRNKGIVPTKEKYSSIFPDIKDLM